MYVGSLTAVLYCTVPIGWSALAACPPASPVACMAKHQMHARPDVYEVLHPSPAHHPSRQVYSIWLALADTK